MKPVNYHFIAKSALIMLLITASWGEVSYCTEIGVNPSFSTERFSLVQVNLGTITEPVYEVFRIDTYTGFVSIIKNNPATGDEFSFIDRDQPSDDIKNPGAVNYRILPSLSGFDRIYMINVNTGATWKLVLKRDKLYFRSVGGVKKIIQP